MSVLGSKFPKKFSHSLFSWGYTVAIQPTSFVFGTRALPIILHTKPPTRACRKQKKFDVVPTPQLKQGVNESYAKQVRPSPARAPFPWNYSVMVRVPSYARWAHSAGFSIDAAVQVILNLCFAGK